MINYFPPQNQDFSYLQTNRSDVLGSLWSSFNLDFQDNLGVMRLAHKLVINTSSDDDANLGTPSAFEFFGGEWFAICGNKIFINDNQEATFTFNEDTASGAISNYNLYSDLAVFDNRIWASSDGKLLERTSFSWDDETGSARLNGETHKLAVLKNTNRLYFVEENDQIGSIDEDKNMVLEGDFFLDLDSSEGYISTMVANSRDLWIPFSVADQDDKTKCRIFQWDGIVAQPRDSYVINAASVLAMCVHKEIPYAIDSNGRILKYTGTAFEEIQRLPIGNVNLLRAVDDSPSSGKFICQNGFISTKNDTLLIAVNNLNEDGVDSVNENLPSGIWEYDMNTGNLTHKHSFTLKERTSATNTDYGQNKLSIIGAIKENTIAVDNSDGQTTLLAGATVFSDATTELSAVYTDFPYYSNVQNNPSGSFNDRELQKRGYFVTTWFKSSQIQDKWLRLWDVHKRFLNNYDKIIYKYRLTEEDPLSDVTITWTSSTTFTTTTDITDYGPSQFNGTIGGEVEILQGTGSGACVHITDISESGGTYTVTIDNEIPNVTGTAKARFQKWIKMYPEVQGQVQSWEELAINNSNTRIQIKGVLEFTGNNEFHKFALVSNEDIKINP